MQDIPTEITIKLIVWVVSNSKLWIYSSTNPTAEEKLMIVLALSFALE